MLLTRAVCCPYSGLQAPCVYVLAPCYATVGGQAEAPELWHDTSPSCGRVSHKWLESALIWIKSRRDWIGYPPLHQNGFSDGDWQNRRTLSPVVSYSILELRSGK